MSYWWHDSSPVDTTGKRRSVFTSAYKNVRYALVFMKTVIVTQADIANLPGFAYDFYGDESAFHVLLAYNGLTDPITDIYVGLPLKLFTKASLDAYLASQTQNSSSIRNTTLTM